MWNPDQVYVVEQARRAELYVEAKQRRLNCGDKPAYRGITAALQALAMWTAGRLRSHRAKGPSLQHELTQR